MKRYVAAVAALSFFLAVFPSAVSASPNGLAWDAVMKFVPRVADALTLQPGDRSLPTSRRHRRSNRKMGAAAAEFSGHLKQAIAAGKGATWADVAERIGRASLRRRYKKSEPTKYRPANGDHYRLQRANDHDAGSEAQNVHSVVSIGFNRQSDSIGIKRLKMISS